MGFILGLYWDNGKENGNYYSIIGFILGLYWDNGKENGNYYSIIGFILGLYWDIGKEKGNYHNLVGCIYIYTYGVSTNLGDPSFRVCILYEGRPKFLGSPQRQGVGSRSH